MKRCTHGKNLSTQVCKYCSCTHGIGDPANCAACNPVPATPALCPHGNPINGLPCIPCELDKGATSGGFTVQIPDDLFLSAEERMKALREQDYRRRLAMLDKVPGAIRMFRTWRLTEDNVLRAMNTTHAWTPGENESSSMRDGGHNGFFGFRTLGELQRQEARWWALSQTGEPATGSTSTVVGLMSLNPWVGQTGSKPVWYVSGTFLGYGHMVVAEHGGRIRYGVPEYIIEPDGSDPDFALRILNVAEKYGMDVISIQTARELKTGRVPYWKGKPIK